VDTVGSEESFFFECVDVKIEESDFFLSCQNPTQGSISLNGKWERAGDSIQVAGKVMWTQKGEALLEQNRRLQLFR
jgi:hypothetical protein